jgi:hypothetical protein
LYVGLICCSIAQSFGRSRSHNVTDGVPWSATVLGDSPTREGQLSVACTAFDYGATARPAAKSTVAGLTPELSPFPPPPPTCKSFTTDASCPDRCFWVAGTCAASPPIICGSNTPGGGANNALCVHVEMNTTEPRTWTYLADEGSYNQTVVVSPPTTVEGGMWYSVWDGEIIKPPSMHPFRYCVQYTAGKNQELQFAVCLSLDGNFDLQVATTNTLTYHAEWQSEAPFVAKVIIQDNVTAAVR